MTEERQARLYRDGKVTRLRHLPTQLREVSAVRTVGFQDAVDDLGTHVMYGREVPYSKAQVYAVLQGRSMSRRLLRRIAEKRPDLLKLRFVPEEVRAMALEEAAGGGDNKPTTASLGGEDNKPTTARGDSKPTTTRGDSKPTTTRGRVGK